MKLTVKKSGNLCGASVYVNGRPLKFKKDKNIKGVYAVQSALAEIDGRVEITIVKRSPFSFGNWFLKVALFWLAGFFGLFSPRYSGRGEFIEYGFSADIAEDGEVMFRADSYDPLNPSRPAVSAGATFSFTEENNVWQTDTVAAKRHKRYRLFNALFWIAAVIACAAAVVVALK